MDIYLQIKNKKGEMFKIVNFSREEYFLSYKEHLRKIINESDYPIFFNDFKAGNYMDTKQIKLLINEVKNIAKKLGKDLENYKTMLEKRSQIENNIFDHSSIKNIMLIGKKRLKEAADEFDEQELKEQLDYIDENIKKLNEAEEYLNIERGKLKFLFDIELLFDTLMEAKNCSSGIYLKTSGTD
jgi:hypothetical protein